MHLRCNIGITGPARARLVGFADNWRFLLRYVLRIVGFVAIYTRLAAQAAVVYAIVRARVTVQIYIRAAPLRARGARAVVLMYGI